jgi:hypothetical protein
MGFDVSGRGGALWAADMNSNLLRARAGIDKLIDIDRRTAVIERQEFVDNGRGADVPFGAPLKHSEVVRVSNESQTVWKYAQTESGVYQENVPYLVARWSADIRNEDVVAVNGRRFRAVEVTRPENFGGIICLQCRLLEL